MCRINDPYKLIILAKICKKNDHIQELKLIFECNETLELYTRSYKASEFDRAKYYFTIH